MHEALTAAACRGGPHVLAEGLWRGEIFIPSVQGLGVCSSQREPPVAGAGWQAGGCVEMGPTEGRRVVPAVSPRGRASLSRCMEQQRIRI